MTGALDLADCDSDLDLVLTTRRNASSGRQLCFQKLLFLKSGGPSHISERCTTSCVALFAERAPRGRAQQHHFSIFIDAIAGVIHHTLVLTNGITCAGILFQLASATPSCCPAWARRWRRTWATLFSITHASRSWHSRCTTPGSALALQIKPETLYALLAQWVQHTRQADLGRLGELEQYCNWSLSETNSERLVPGMLWAHNGLEGDEQLPAQELGHRAKPSGHL